jgi:putative sterol carrier protein
VNTDNHKTPGDLFQALAELLQREPSRTAGLTALYQFEITGRAGGWWYVDIVNGKASVIEGEAPNPNCTIVMASSDYVDMATGVLSGHVAFMTGKLMVSGDTSLAMRAAQIFGRG